MHRRPMSLLSSLSATVFPRLFPRRAMVASCGGTRLLFPSLFPLVAYSPTTTVLISRRQMVDSPSRQGGMEAESSLLQTSPLIPVSLTLDITDHDLLSYLLRFPPESVERNVAAITAMRVGVVALRHAQGQVDSHSVKQEVDQMLHTLEHRLQMHQMTVQSRLGEALKAYFDPHSGSFSERINRLIRKDGELSSAMLGVIQGEDSAFVKTLSSFLGENSPMMKAMDPQHRDGLISKITRAVGMEMVQHREHILKEFSLDNKDGSLVRVIGELQQQSRTLAGDVSMRMDNLIDEFSLDRDNSALSRLVKRVELNQRLFAEQFSLETQSSSLFRLRRELLDTLERQNRTIVAMERLVVKEMTAVGARRAQEEAVNEVLQRSPEHGLRFEAAVAQHINRLSLRYGDVAEVVGQRTGWIRHCKVGDIVVTIGADQSNSGSRIVFEAKDAQGYNLAKVVDELETAKKNRSADVGVFVFSQKAAPQGMSSFTRMGRNLIVIVDNPSAPIIPSPIILDAAFSVAKALCSREYSNGRNTGDDETNDPENKRLKKLRSQTLANLELAIRDVEKQVESLEDIKKSAESIHQSSVRILTRVRLLDQRLLSSIDILESCSSFLRSEYGHPLSSKKKKEKVLTNEIIAKKLKVAMDEDPMEAVEKLELDRSDTGYSIGAEVVGDTDPIRSSNGDNSL